MQYTTHYNLNLPEGTDIVNPLVQDNPNYTAIDTALYNNKLRVIGSASEVKSGTVHAITRSDTDINIFRFVATSNYVTGDTFTVDGTSVTAVLPDGTNPKNGAFVINASVLCILDGARLSLVGIEGSVEASDVEYDNSNSGLSANNVNSAIDEVNDNIGFTDITSSCTINSIVSGCRVMYNEKMKLVKVVGIAPAGTSSATTLITLPSGITSIGVTQVVSWNYDNVNNIRISTEIAANSNYIRTAYSTSTTSGIGFSISGDFFVN